MRTQQADLPRAGDEPAPAALPCRGWLVMEANQADACATDAMVDPIPRRLESGRLTWFPATQCGACEAKEAVCRARTTFVRLELESCLPPRYRGYSLRRVVPQGRGESPTDFMARVRALPAPTVGVTAWNHRIVASMRTWKPGRGGLYLTGPVGGGKTMLVCAMLSDFMRAGTGVIYLTESVLYGWLRAHALPRTGASGQAASDLPRDARSIPLLALDDIGSTADLTDRQRDTFEAIVCARYDRNLPIVVTSNYTIATIAGKAYYGERVASRLTEMCGRQQIHLVGYDWRTGQRHATQAQPVTPPAGRLPTPPPIPTRTPTPQHRPLPTPDYKRLASGDDD